MMIFALFFMMIFDGYLSFIILALIFTIVYKLIASQVPPSVSQDHYFYFSKIRFHIDISIYFPFTSLVLYTSSPISI